MSTNDLNKFDKTTRTTSSSMMISSASSSSSIKNDIGGGINGSRNGLSSSSPSPRPSSAINFKSKSPSPAALRKSCYNEFEKSCLKAHNEFRVKHGVPTLKLSKKLCRFAEEWAKVIAARGTPIHRNNSPYGENIFCSWNSNSNVIVKGWEPVEHWYSEGCTHIFGKEPTTLKTGHFTQVVWNDSREFGVGQARNRYKIIYLFICV